MTLEKPASTGGTAAGNEEPAIRIVGLEKHFRRTGGGAVTAVAGVSLDVEPGEMVVVLGPSGCGKTTLLRCIAGLEAPTGGEIYSRNRLISSGDRGVIVPPEKRTFGMMFQSYAVWPHMSVFQNVAYPLKLRRVSKAEIQERVRRILDLVGIGDLGAEYSSQLSGGQQQRIALARSLVADPEVILFDEPLSNVDAKVREDLRIELLTMQKRIGFAGVYVTHDQEEAMAIADRIVVMKDGEVVQVGPPDQVYGAPLSRFVASFIGVVNEFVGEVRETGDVSPAVVDTEIGEMSLASENMTAGTKAGDQVAVVIRPESVSVSAMRPESDGESNTWPGTLRAQMFRGSYRDYLVDVGSRQIRARGGSAGGRSAARGVFHEGEAVFLTVPAKAIRAIPINSGRGEANGEGSVEPVFSDSNVPRSVEEIGGAGTVPD